MRYGSRQAFMTSGLQVRRAVARTSGQAVSCRDVPTRAKAPKWVDSAFALTFCSCRSYGFTVLHTCLLIQRSTCQLPAATRTKCAHILSPSRPRPCPAHLSLTFSFFHNDYMLTSNTARVRARCTVRAPDTRTGHRLHGQERGWLPALSAPGACRRSKVKVQMA